jgi:hypothetical protein
VRLCATWWGFLPGEVLVVLNTLLQESYTDAIKDKAQRAKERVQVCVHDLAGSGWIPEGGGGGGRCPSWYRCVPAGCHKSTLVENCTPVVQAGV